MTIGIIIGLIATVIGVSMARFALHRSHRASPDPHDVAYAGNVGRGLLLTVLRGLRLLLVAVVLLLRGARDLRSRIPQRGSDLVHLHLDAGTLVALLVGVLVLFESALCDDPHALVEGLGHMVGHVTPCGTADEQCLTVLELVRLTVERARRGCDGEADDVDSGVGGVGFWVGGEVADDRDGGFSGH